MSVPFDLDRLEADLTAEGGWTKHSYGRYESPDGPCCMLGGIARQCLQQNDGGSAFHWEDEAHALFVPIIDDLFRDRFVNLYDEDEDEDPIDYIAVPDFNDHPDTSLEDVVTVIREAKKRLANAEV